MNQGYLKGLEFADMAAANAGETWQAMAYDHLVRYASRGKPFMVEEVRSFYQLPPPPDQRAWGSIVNAAKRNKVIKRVQFAQSNDKSKHGATVTLWQKI